jgi:hypothetical protein
MVILKICECSKYRCGLVDFHPSALITNRILFRICVTTSKTKENVRGTQQNPFVADPKALNVMDFNVDNLKHISHHIQTMKKDDSVFFCYLSIQIRKSLLKPSDV